MSIDDIASIPVEYEIFCGDNRFSDEDGYESDNSYDVIDNVEQNQAQKPVQQRQYTTRDIFSQSQLRKIEEILAGGEIPKKILVRDRKTYDDFTADVEARNISISLIYESRTSQDVLTPQNRTIFSDSKRGWGECGLQICPGEKLHNIEFKN